MRTQWILALFFGFAFLAAAQVAMREGDEFCSMAFVNAASVEAIELRVQDRVWYPRFASGQRTGAGRIPRLNWPIKIKSSESGALLEFDFQAEQAKSYIAVILGDFEKILVRDEEGKETEKLRAQVDVFPTNFLPGARPHRVRIINGLTDTPVTVPAAEGDMKLLGFGDFIEIDGLPSSANVSVLVGEQPRELTFLFVPPETGSTVVFYDGANKPELVIVNEVNMLPDGTRPVPNPEEVESVMQDSQADEE